MKPNNNQNLSKNNFVARKISSGRDNQAKKSQRAENPKPDQPLNNLPFKISSNHTVNRNNDRINNHQLSESHQKSPDELQVKNRDDSQNKSIENNVRDEKIASPNAVNSDTKEVNADQDIGAHIDDNKNFDHRNYNRHGKNRQQRVHGQDRKDHFKNKESSNESSSNHQDFKPQDFKSRKRGFLYVLIDKIKKLLGLKKADKFAHKKHHRNFNNHDSGNHRKRRSKRNRNSSNHSKQHNRY